jgi:anti-anti-sigma factor
VLDASHPGSDAIHSPAELSVVPPGPDLAIAPVPEPRPAPVHDLLDGLLSDGEDTLSLVLDGAVDSRLEAELSEMLTSLRSADVRHIVLELASVTAMDAAGLRFLYAVQGLALERGGSVRLADPPDVVLDLIAENGAPAVPDGSAEVWPGARPA